MNTMLALDVTPKVEIWPLIVCTMQNMHYNPYFWAKFCRNTQILTAYCAKSQYLHISAIKDGRRETAVILEIDNLQYPRNRPTGHDKLLHKHANCD